MNIVSWNVRGLGMPSKWFLVKDFLQLHHADICCLQESKLSSINSITWKSIGGVRLDHFSFVPKIGSAGGIIIGWNNNLFIGNVRFKGTYTLTIEFTTRISNVVWLCTTVYGPNARHLKQSFREFHLFEPPSFGKQFTWTNGQANPIWVKLDRFLVNSSWMDSFPRVIQNCLPS